VHTQHVGAKHFEFYDTFLKFLIWGTLIFSDRASPFILNLNKFSERVLSVQFLLLIFIKFVFFFKQEAQVGWLFYWVREDRFGHNFFLLLTFERGFVLFLLPWIGFLCLLRNCNFTFFSEGRCVSSRRRWSLSHRWKLNTRFYMFLLKRYLVILLLRLINFSLWLHLTLLSDHEPLFLLESTKKVIWTASYFFDILFIG